MVHFITYSNDLYSETREYCAKMAKRKGKVDTVTVYKPEDIEDSFREEYKQILDLRVGNGLWLWKPYFVLKKLQELDDGDIVLYCDAGSFFFRSCKSIIDSMNDDIWVSNIALVEKQFTKPELFTIMNCKGEKYTETNQVQANFIAIRKTPRGMQFAEEWLKWCCQDNVLIQDTDPKLYVYEDKFCGHRSDQSVLSLLAKKWNLKIHQDPSQYGRVPEKYYAEGRLFVRPENVGEYKPCIILHRGKRPEFKICLNQWICVWIPKFMFYFFSKSYRSICDKNNE